MKEKTWTKTKTASEKQGKKKRKMRIAKDAKMKLTGKELSGKAGGTQKREWKMNERAYQRFEISIERRATIKECRPETGQQRTEKNWAWASKTKQSKQVTQVFEKRIDQCRTCEPRCILRGSFSQVIINFPISLFCLSEKIQQTSKQATSTESARMREEVKEGFEWKKKKKNNRTPRKNEKEAVEKLPAQRTGRTTQNWNEPIENEPQFSRVTFLSKWHLRSFRYLPALPRFPSLITHRPTEAK